MRKLAILISILALSSCAPIPKTTVILDNEQYGVVYDNYFNAPISYKARYVQPKSQSCQICIINPHVLDNLYFFRGTRALECSPDAPYTDYYIIKEK